MVLNAEHKIQIQLLPPYISLNPPISTPKPTNLHPLDVGPTSPLDLVFCSQVLLLIGTSNSLRCCVFVWIVQSKQHTLSSW